MTYLVDDDQATVEAFAAILLRQARGAALRTRALADALLAEAETITEAGEAGDRIVAAARAFAEEAPAMAPAEAVLDELAALAPESEAGIRVLGAAEAAILAASAELLRREPLGAVEDAEALGARLERRFDRAEARLAEVADGAHWRALAGLRGAVARYLAETSTMLPRRRRIATGEPLPALALAWRLYQDADRAEELAAENRAIHPAFMPVELTALSA